MRHALPALVIAIVVAACGDDASRIDAEPCLDGCAIAPPSECASDTTLRVYTAPGACDAEASCAFAHADVDCPLGCAGGACVGDPCSDVTCDEPPTPCHAPIGLCTAGVCDYGVIPGATCDDGDACTRDDRCRADAVCRGTVEPCAEPPASTCDDDDSLTVYAAEGTCQDGACTYEPQTLTCSDGCDGGACLGDPCAGVICDDPPSACHDAAGTCHDGVCRYAFDDGVPCDDGDACTAGDACQSGACDGEPRACATPPANTCDDAGTLRVHSAAGQCSGDGACTYPVQTVACAHGCDAGACLGDPCGNVTCATPPPPSCDGATATAWSAVGACAGGVCSYAPTTTPCAHGCDAGACLPPVGLTLSEVLVDSASFPDTDAFVEIHGPPGATLDGAAIVGVNGNGGAVYVTIPLTGTLDAAGLYVVAHPGAAPWVADMADVTDARVDLQNGPDSVQLRFGAVVLDALGYGTFTGGAAFAGEGTPHPTAAVGDSLHRDAVYTDTDDNLADFRAGLATPGVATPAPVAVVAAVAAPDGPIHPGDPVTFDASASSGPIATWTFDFGDGSAPVTSGVATAAHTYDAAGSWVVTVTVSDDAGGSDVASVTVEVVAPTASDDPFDPGSCPGAPWTSEAALARLDGASSAILDAQTVMQRSRTCTADGCGPWSASSANSIRYLTWSGGSVTRYKTLQTDTSLVLWSSGGAPKLSVRHATHLSRYPNDHDEGVTFGFPAQVVSHPQMHAYNYFPDGQYDYRDIWNYLGRDAQLSVSADCARFISVLPNLTGPVTTEYVAVYRF